MAVDRAGAGRNRAAREGDGGDRGHPYDAAFGSLFEGYPEISAKIYPRDVAFGWDMRAEWDVLVFYDLTQKISEIEKKNLQAFVEGGKGLVVLHHALADYGEWEWWWKEVVGGRYLLQAEGGAAASTYKRDQEVEIEPVAEHWITKGLGRFRLTDEVYQLMWRGPGIQPILKTGHSLSDAVIGWISPYAKSRVVAIQSGHDRKSYLNRSYRRLVRNSIVWAAGRQE